MASTLGGNPGSVASDCTCRSITSLVTFRATDSPENLFRSRPDFRPEEVDNGPKDGHVTICDINTYPNPLPLWSSWRAYCAINL
jgi:hypothetical protein